MNYKRLILVVVLLLRMSFVGAKGATVTWTNTSGGLWSAATNWDTRFVPRSFDSVSIVTPGTYTVTVDTNVFIANLILGGASGAQTMTNYNQFIAATNAVIAANGMLALGGGTISGTNLVMQGKMNWSGAILSIPLTVSGGGVLNISGAATALYSPLTNLGTIYWRSNTTSIAVANNHAIYTGIIYNQNGGLFEIQNDQTLSCACYGFEAFVNTGTVRKSGGVGATTINVSFTNNGMVDAQSGTIQFTGSGNIGGTYNTAAGSIIQFLSGNYVETGTTTNTGAGIFRQNGANVTLNERITKFALLNGNVGLSSTFQGGGAIQNLQLDGAFLVGTNRVTGTLGFNGGGMASASPLTVTAGGVLNFNGAAPNIYAPLTNSGIIYWSGGGVSIANNHGIYTGAIYNQAGGLFNLQNDQACSSAGYGFEFMNNAGTVRKSAGLGTSAFNLPVTNTGTMDAQSGTIQFGGNGNIGGTYNTASGAVIQFNGGSYLQTGAPAVTGSGVCRQNGATVTLNDKINNFLLISGNVALTPTFQTNGTIYNLQLNGAFLTGTNRVTGTLGFDGGGVASASPLTVATNAVLNFNGAGVNIYALVTNGGTINWSSGAVSVANNLGLYSGGFYNLAGGTFNLQCDQGVNSAGYGSEFFNNAGTIRKTAGLGVTTFGLPFSNTGTVDAQTGIIQFSGGGNIAGTYNAALGAIIQFYIGSFTETGTTVVTGTGLCRQNGATITLKDKIGGFVLASGNVALSSTFQGSGAIQDLQLDGAFLTGTNTVIGTLGFNGGGVASASTLTVSGTGVLDFNGAGVNIYSPLTNNGTINWSSGAVSVANNAGLYTGVLYNQPGGLLKVQCDQGISSAGYGFELFSNTGTVRKTAGLGTTTISLTFVNNGTLDAQSGTIRVSGPYTQAGGTMNFGITSLSYFGQIAFSANAPITGTLSVNFNGSYFPSAGDSFPLLSYATHSGTFNTLALPTQAQWQPNYGATIFSLSILNVTGGLPVTLTPISFGAGKFTLQLNGSIGPQYILQASTNLANWASILTNTPAAMPVTLIDVNAGTFPRRFYRALVGP